MTLFFLPSSRSMCHPRVCGDPYESWIPGLAPGMTVEECGMTKGVPGMTKSGVPGMTRGGVRDDR